MSFQNSGLSYTAKNRSRVCIIIYVHAVDCIYTYRSNRFVNLINRAKFTAINQVHISNKELVTKMCKKLIDLYIYYFMRDIRDNGALDNMWISMEAIYVMC